MKWLWFLLYIYFILYIRLYILNRIRTIILYIYTWYELVVNSDDHYVSQYHSGIHHRYLFNYFICLVNSKILLMKIADSGFVSSFLHWLYISFILFNFYTTNVFIFVAFEIILLQILMEIPKYIYVNVFDGIIHLCQRIHAIHASC